MQFSIDLKQIQTIKLTLTPELRQSINILQYSSLELIEFIQQQTVENPIVELKEKPIDYFISRRGKEPFSSFHTQHRERDFDPILQYSNTNISLEMYLLEQINTLPGITIELKKILKFLIGHLNHYGFLEIKLEDAVKNLSVTLDEVEKAIIVLQSLDPIGVGARNIKESLLIQLRVQSLENHLAYKIIENHLEDIAAKRFRKMSKIYQVTLKEIQEVADYIKTLNPRPCSEFSDEMTQYIVPDVMVEKVKGEYIIIVNDSILPQISINPILARNLLGIEDDYIKQKIQDAKMLMNGIEQRKYTLMKVVQAILNMQREFFEEGLAKLKPMTLKDISEELGFHESTISRATSNKYIQTPHGLFHLKKLFTNGLSKNASITTESSISIKGKIKRLIAEENKEKPISDQMIAALLQHEGIQISRRTVAKYREEAGIPGSSKRRRY
nr:RNA polymerase factor sigma-54 [uncultured Bacillus sp.]